MNKRNSQIRTLLLLLTVSFGANALTVGQFQAICQSGEQPCSEVRLLQAYVGGGLDTIASLDEKTDYLKQVYCADSRELFNVPAIIRYIETLGSEDASQNAGLMIVRYLEQNGECEK